jgi:N-acetylglucosaminyldiphosphoundecaprenol N-acetyl-beta-D-mannosaminyltransferase
MKVVDLAGCPVGALSREAWAARLAAWIDEGTPHHHVSLNAAKWVAMRRDGSLRRAVRSATSVAADGASVLAAARWLGDPLPERVTGCDLAHDLLELAPHTGWRIYLLGATSDVVDEVSRRLDASGVTVAGTRDGYFAPDEERDIAEAIRDARPELLLVAMGSPRSELFVARWGTTMAVPLAMGVGGTFDVLAGRARRAPDAVGRLGLEWAWRWVSSPRVRFRRAIVDSVEFAVSIGLGRRIPS